MSLLWSLHPPNGKPSWLFGTMHIRDDRAYQICSGLYPLIQSCDVYVGEMDLGVIEENSTSPMYDMQAYFKPAAYLKIKKQIQKSFFLNLDQLVHLHPLLIMGIITHKILVQDHAISLDEHLWNYALEHQLVLQGLESLEEQTALLHSIAPEPLYKQIRGIGSRPENIRKFMEKALDLYIREEIHALYKLTKSSMRHLRKRIIYQRNASMLQRILNFDPSSSYFITVGAGHLSGKYGLITLLRKQGVDVRPIKMDRG